MKTIFTRVCLAAFAFMLPCVMSATVLAPFGQFEKQTWTGKYFYALISSGEQPPADWYTADFDDSAWGTLTGPVSLPSSKGTPLPYFSTTWNANNSSYWVRTHFTVDDLDKELYLFYVTHDDVCKAYLNGVQIYYREDCTAYDTYSNVFLKGNALQALKTGDNVLAVYVSDTGGGMAFMDFGLYGYDMEDIVASAIPVTITDEGAYPWVFSGSELSNGNAGKANSVSELKFSYTSDYATEFSFDWYEYNYYSHQPLQVFVDGELRGQTSNGSYTSFRLFAAPGTHEVTFRDSIGNSTNTRNVSRLKNIRIREIPPLETAVLSEKSMPLTFTNDNRFPWTVEDGYIQSSNYGNANSSARFSTTFTIDKTSKFSFWWRVSSNDSYHNLYATLNGMTYLQDYSNTSFVRYAVALEPGTYTVEWKDTLSSYYYSNYSQIKDIELSCDWLTCQLESAGTLNVAALDQVETLDDVELLKIVGPVSADDWATIAYMRNLLAIDLSEAVLTQIPASAFKNNTQLSSAILPEGLTYIGDYAFQNTTLRQIKIPATVTSIGSNAFYGQPLEKVEFAENSKMNGFGYYTFAYCRNLKSMILPNTMTFLGNYDFYECNNLQELWISDGITELPPYLACKADLRKLHLPKNLKTIANNAIDLNQHLERVSFPETLTSIGRYAFSGCYALDSVCLPLHLTSLGDYAFNANWSLTYLELPSYISSYNNNFPECTSLQKVVCRSVTPPVISSDPFQRCPAKSAITLVVPEFAMTSYGYDNYWQQFTTMEAGEPVDYWMVNTKLTLENSQRMEGKPDVDVNYGGQFTVNGSTPLALGLLNLFVSEASPCRLLNHCEAMGADSVNTCFAVDANKWYFFTPLHDVDLTKVSMTNSPSFVFRYYDAQNRALNGASGSWKNVDDGKLNGGQGYIFQCNKSSVITMPATALGRTQVLTAYDVTKPLATYEAVNASNKSWNYVGNPYPAYYDIYYMDFTAPITIWNGSTYKAYSVVDDNYVLRPMQSFFVQKPDGVENIVFHREGRQLSSAVERAAARAAAEEVRCVFDLTIAADGTFDESHADDTRIVINDRASLDYEMTRDASKFLSLQSGVPQLLTVDAQGNSYAINERPLCDGRVPLAYYADRDGFYTLSLHRSKGKVCLYDAEQDNTVELTAGSYTFYSNATGSIDSSRFTLTFSVDGGTTAIEELSSQPETNAQGTVFDMQGRRTSAAKKGIYMKNNRKVVNR